MNQKNNLSTEDLLENIGIALLNQDDPNLLSGELSRKDIISVARKWYAEIRKTLQKKICMDERVSNLWEEESSSREKMLIIVADILSAASLNVPTGSLTELFIRDGLKSYCAEYLEKK